MEIKVNDLSREELIDLVKKLFKEKEELERELKKYKNPHTPPSSNKHIKPETLGLKAKIEAKRGAPVGHRGATLQLPDSEEIIPVLGQECGSCHGKNIEPTGYTKTKRLYILSNQEQLLKNINNKKSDVLIVINLLLLLIGIFHNKEYMTRPFRVLSTILNSKHDCHTISSSIV